MTMKTDRVGIDRRFDALLDGLRTAGGENLVPRSTDAEVTGNDVLQAVAACERCFQAGASCSPGRSTCVLLRIRIQTQVGDTEVHVHQIARAYHVIFCREHRALEVLLLHRGAALTPTDGTRSAASIQQCALDTTTRSLVRVTPG